MAAKQGPTTEARVKPTKIHTAIKTLGIGSHVYLGFVCLAQLLGKLAEIPGMNETIVNSIITLAFVAWALGPICWWIADTVRQ